MTEIFEVLLRERKQLRIEYQILKMQYIKELKSLKNLKKEFRAKENVSKTIVVDDNFIERVARRTCESLISRTPF
ncbi:MAG: hypothetical protein C5B52_01455 [Bacteroidetes bacterium]|nr:MAG: hypothetical protein C5B52_01455 [Bacteroidota bacterium]